MNWRVYLMTLTNEEIKQQIRCKREQEERKKTTDALELAALEKELEAKKQQIEVVRRMLDAANHDLADRNAELKHRQEVYDSTTGALYNELVSSGAHVASMMDQLDIIRSKATTAKGEIRSTVSDLTDTLRAISLDVAATLNHFEKVADRSVVVHDRTALTTIIRLNPGMVILAEDENGIIHTIDTRESGTRAINDALATEKQGNVQPFRCVHPLNPISSVNGGTICTFEALFDALSSYTRWSEQVPKGIIISPAHGGVRLQVHKQGPRVACFTDDMVDVADNIPTVVESLRLVPHDFVIDTVLEVGAGTKALKKSEIMGVILYNDTALEPKSKLIVTDVLWMDGKDCHGDGFEERISNIDVFLDRYRNISPSKLMKVYTKHDAAEAISKASRLPNSMGAMIYHPEHMYNLSGTTPMAMAFYPKKMLVVKIIHSTEVGKDMEKWVHDCVVMNEHDIEYFVGKTDITTLGPGSDALRVEFDKLIKYIDPVTEQPHFNWIGVKVKDTAPAKEISSLAEAEAYSKMDGCNAMNYRAVPELGVVIEENPLPTGDITVDCGCRAKKAEEFMDMEFKLKEQSFTITTDEEQKTRSKYHLLLQLPSKIVDFETTLNPTNQCPCTAKKSITQKLLWDTVGELSPRHKLNDGLKQKSKIVTVDQGTCRIYTDGDMDYTMKMVLTGEFLTGYFTASRLNNYTDTWNIAKDEVV